MTPEAFWNLLEPPDADSPRITEWAEQLRLFQLLERQRRGGPIVLHAWCTNTGFLLIDTLLVPLETIATFDTSKLHRWDSLRASPYCGLVEGGGLPPRGEFEPGFYTVAGTDLSDNTQLVCHRHFEGRTEDSDYFEVSPSLTHPHDLHWVPERQSWCPPRCPMATWSPSSSWLRWPHAEPSKLPRSSQSPERSSNSICLPQTPP